MWLSEIGEYFYKSRSYSANMGRFLQTDPMGYSSGPNLYEYVSSDPVNLVDPLGLVSDIFVFHQRLRPIEPPPSPLPNGFFSTGGFGIANSTGGPGEGRTRQNQRPTCTLRQRQVQNFGEKISNTGDIMSGLGLLGAAAGGGLAFLGGATLDPGLVLLGGEGFEDSVAFVKVGGILQTIGASVSALGANNTPISRDLFNRSISLSIGRHLNEYEKGLLDKALSKAEDAIGLQAQGNCRR